jgi:DNA-directed RNA polymerase subunit RPC12/RpoP
MGRAPDVLPCTWVYRCTACGADVAVDMPQGQFVAEAGYRCGGCMLAAVPATVAPVPAADWSPREMLQQLGLLREDGSPTRDEA